MRSSDDPVVNCKTCDGEGIVSNALGPHPCKTCFGSGRRPRPAPGYSHANDSERVCRARVCACSGCSDECACRRGGDSPFAFCRDCEAPLYRVKRARLEVAS